MYVDVSERAFEDAIEAGLLQHAEGEIGERRSSYLDMKPRGYNMRRSEDYDRAYCIIPRDLLDFVLATQPQEWDEADPASRGTGERAVSQASVIRATQQRRARSAAQRNQGHGLPLPACLLSPRKRTE